MMIIPVAKHGPASYPKKTNKRSWLFSAVPWVQCKKYTEKVKSTFSLANTADIFGTKVLKLFGGNSIFFELTVISKTDLLIAYLNHEITHNTGVGTTKHTTIDWAALVSQ